MRRLCCGGCCRRGSERHEVSLGGGVCGVWGREIMRALISWCSLVLCMPGVEVGTGLSVLSV